MAAGVSTQAAIVCFQSRHHSRNGSPAWPCRGHPADPVPVGQQHVLCSSMITVLHGLQTHPHPDPVQPATCLMSMTIPAWPTGRTPAPTSQAATCCAHDWHSCRGLRPTQPWATCLMLHDNSTPLQHTDSNVQAQVDVPACIAVADDA